MLPIIRGMSKISLRVIDHFITNYSKKNRITYNLIEENNKFKYLMLMHLINHN